ncbi:MAG TPA: nucleotide sugar dehydrogenase [Polyangiaceae bacterium]
MSEPASDTAARSAGHHDAFMRRLSEGSLHVGVIGLGNVGLPLALAFVEHGQLRVTGFDIDDAKVTQLNRGEGYIMHLGQDRVRAARASGRFDATSDFSRLGEPDALLIAVPTPLTSGREPDMRFVTDTTQAIARALRPGQLIVLESTSYPGTTEELVQPLLERSGLRSGLDFFLAFSPEREDPGNREFGTADIPKLVGGVDANATSVALALYRKAVKTVVPVASAAVAEAAKLTENIFRAVNIALVNELKVIYEKMGLDIWEVLDAAQTKPFGFMRFNPGPGWGGHCIPVDPFYLTWKARQFGIGTRFIELAGEINVQIPQYVVERLSFALRERGKSLARSRVLLLGIAYKRNIDDLRESPAFDLMQRLTACDANVTYHDPHVPRIPALRSRPELAARTSVPLTPEQLRDTDAVIIVTDHDAVDYPFVLEHAPLIIDTRGVYRQLHPKVVKA